MQCFLSHRQIKQSTLSRLKLTFIQSEITFRVTYTHVSSPLSINQSINHVGHEFLKKGQQSDWQSIHDYKLPSWCVIRYPSRFRWPGCFSTKALFWRYRITLLPGTPEYPCRTISTGPGSYISTTCTRRTRESTCARLTLLLPKRNMAIYTL